MSCIQIIPAIDLIEGKCVRLTQGDYSQKKIYNEDPLEVAKAFEGVGISRLHLVDLDGAKANHIVNYNVLEKIAGHTSLTIDFGGGLKSDEDLRIAFDSGASMITGGSIAVKNRLLFTSWLMRYGKDKIILGADAKDEKIAISGWQESTQIDLYEFIEHYHKEGVCKVICTDIGKDGMMQGPSTDLYKKLLQRTPDIFLIASGGVSKMSDIDQLEEIGVPAVITGKALYEGTISMKEISNKLK